MSDSIIDAEVISSKKSPNQVSIERFEEMSGTVLDHSGSIYLQVRIDHIKHLKGDCDAAVVLSYFLNHFRLKTQTQKGKEALMRNGLWFKSPIGDARKWLNMGEDRMRTAIANLIDTQLIKSVKRAGNNNWVQINDELLRKIGRTHKQNEIRGTPESEPETGNVRNGEPPNLRETGNPRISISKKRKEETTPASPSANGGVLLGFQQLNGESSRSPQREIAAQIFKVLQKHNKLGNNEPTPQRPAHRIVADWSQWITKLENKGRRLKDIEHAVKTFVADFGNQYLPRIRCGKHLYEKFDSLLDYIERKQAKSVDSTSKVDRPSHILTKEEQW